MYGLNLQWGRHRRTQPHVLLQRRCCVAAQAHAAAFQPLLQDHCRIAVQARVAAELGARKHRLRCTHCTAVGLLHRSSTSGSSRVAHVAVAAP
jgi:hypothetical protein